MKAEATNLPPPSPQPPVSPDGEQRFSPAEGSSQPVAGLVSVVLIFHNEARYLGDAIRSVQAQSYPHWELLLVDDGSNDASPAIAAAAVEADPERIRYLSQPRGVNRGMSASRNLGLASARGEYVAFLDGDDIYLPERLQRHVDILQHFPRIAMVQSDHVRWRSWAGPGDDPVRPFFTVGDQVLWPPLGLRRIIAVPYLVAGICNITVRRQVAWQVDGFEDVFTGPYEDQVFVARVSLRHPVYVLQDYLACYRHHPASAIRRLVHAGGPGGDTLDALSRQYLDWLIALLEAYDGDRDHMLALARARRARLEPTPARRRKNAIVGNSKALLRSLLPSAWYAALLDLDYRRSAKAARRSYATLAARLTAETRQREQ